MSQRLRKFTASLVLVTISTLVAGLCFGTVSQTAAANEFALLAMATSHCGDGEAPIQKETVAFEQSYPAGNTVAPCCVGRHDNLPIIAAAGSNDRVKLSGTAMSLVTAEPAAFVSEKTYASSLSPPPRPDKLSSLLKKE